MARHDRGMSQALSRGLRDAKNEMPKMGCQKWGAKNGLLMRVANERDSEGYANHTRFLLEKTADTGRQKNNEKG